MYSGWSHMKQFSNSVQWRQMSIMIILSRPTAHENKGGKIFPSFQGILLYRALAVPHPCALSALKHSVLPSQGKICLP